MSLKRRPSAGGEPAGAREVASHADWRLRTTLGAVLASLVTTAVVASGGPGALTVAAGSPASSTGTVPVAGTGFVSGAGAVAGTGAPGGRDGAGAAGKALTGTPQAGASQAGGSQAGGSQAGAQGSGSTTTAPAAGSQPPRWSAGGACGLSLGAASPSRPVGRCTVLEIGDSLGNDLGWGLARQVTASSGLDLVQADVSATGLVDTSFYDWPAHLAADLRRYHPQLVIISLGGNDQQGMMVGGSAVQFPSAPWQRAYLARVDGILGEARQAGASVMWVGMPPMSQPGFSSGMQVLDSLYRQAVVSQPSDVFVPVWSLFSDPQGLFQSQALVNGSPATLRQADGIHYSFTGENVLATYVVGQIAAAYHVSLAPSSPAVITGWG